MNYLAQTTKFILNQILQNMKILFHDWEEVILADKYQWYCYLELKKIFLLLK